MSSKRRFEVFNLEDPFDESEDEILPKRPVKTSRTTGTITTPINISDDDVEPPPFTSLRNTAVMNNPLDALPDGLARFVRRDTRTFDQHRRSPAIGYGIDESDVSDSTPGSFTDTFFDDTFAENQPVLPVLHTQPIMTDQDRFNQILEMFPDIAHDHARSLIDENGGSLEQVIDKLVQSPNYPKKRGKKLPAKREKPDTDDENDMSIQDLDSNVAGKERRAVLEVLRYEFPKIPICFIKKTQTEKGALYATYLALNEAQHTNPQPYNKAPWRPLGILNFELIGMTNGVARTVLADLEKQYKSAKKACELINAQNRREAALKKQEEANAEEAKAFGAVSECTVCFDECPLDRMVQCSQNSPHFTCFECMLNFIKSEVGQSRCRLTCPDSSGCDGVYTESQLRQVPGDDALLNQLLHLQQEQDIRDAGIDDVGSCPFCGFKTVCLSIDVDFEFRCQDPECGITSCRKCQKEGHIPDTCDEALQKRSEDAALYHRHKIEEAMSEALKRICNRCKKSFVKTDGCNKMTCPGCRNTQCYVCSKDVQGYEHFRRGGCPQMDNVEARHAKEIKEAQDAARAKVAAENPDVQSELLEIKVSDAVREAEAEAHRAQLMFLERRNRARVLNFHLQERRDFNGLRRADPDRLENRPRPEDNNAAGGFRGDFGARLDHLHTARQEMRDILRLELGQRQNMNNHLGGLPRFVELGANEFDEWLARHRPDPENFDARDLLNLRDLLNARDLLNQGGRPEPRLVPLNLPAQLQREPNHHLNPNPAQGGWVDPTVPRWQEQLQQRRQQRHGPRPQDVGLLGREGTQPAEVPPQLYQDEDWFDD